MFQSSSHFFRSIYRYPKIVKNIPRTAQPGYAFSHSHGQQKFSVSVCRTRLRWRRWFWFLNKTMYFESCQTTISAGWFFIATYIQLVSYVFKFERRPKYNLTEDTDLACKSHQIRSQGKGNSQDKLFKLLDTNGKIWLKNIQRKGLILMLYGIMYFLC